MCDKCRTMLSEGLDLCVRARELDAQDRTNAQMAISSAPKEWWDENLPRRVARHNAIFPDQPMSMRSGTPALWLLDQYEKDLADWERRGRQHLMQGCLKDEPCEYCSDGKRTGLPGNACENCMGTGLKNPPVPNGDL